MIDNRLMQEEIVNYHHTFEQADNADPLWDYIYSLKDDFSFDRLFYHMRFTSGSFEPQLQHYAFRGLDQSLNAPIESELNDWNTFTLQPSWPPISRPLPYEEWLKYFVKDTPRMQPLYERALLFFPTGWVFPTYGPKKRRGYFLFNLQNTLSGEQIKQLHWHSQSTHLQYCEFLDANATRKTKLTAREKEILYWVAQGKSNSVIADIMNISAHTVNGYLRKIYLKTETSDRVTSALRAIAEGWLD